jgi:hypothetical protein
MALKKLFWGIFEDSLRCYFPSELPVMAVDKKTRQAMEEPAFYSKRFNEIYHNGLIKQKLVIVSLGNYMLSKIQIEG